jgi:hypothetical protein
MTYLLAWALGANPAGRSLVAAALAVPVLAVGLFLWNCLRYPPTIHSELRTANESLRIISERRTIRNGMSNLAHEARRRAVDFRRQQDPLDAAIVHDSALWISQQASQALAGYHGYTERFEREAATISASVPLKAPGDAEAALRELDKLQELIEQQLRENRFE